MLIYQLKWSKIKVGCILENWMKYYLLKLAVGEGVRLLPEAWSGLPRTSKMEGFVTSRKSLTIVVKPSISGVFIGPSNASSHSAQTEINH